MKKLTMLVASVMLFAICLPVIAQEFPDVPPDHWAYDAVQDLAEKGIIQGYPDGLFQGKRAMTRYEFAEALSKAIPVIAEMVGAGPVTGPSGDFATKGEVDALSQRVKALEERPVPPGQATKEEVDALRKLVDEFRDELAAVGVDVEAVRRDIAALSDRVTALENEVQRVKLTGGVNLIARGEVLNSGTAFDKDQRPLATASPAGEKSHILANSTVFTDWDFDLTARVSDEAKLKASINAGDYSTFAIGTVDDFTLWSLYMDGAVKLGPLGTANVMVGRFPFQLTPLTLKFVDPDSYAYVSRLDDGNFVLDGGAATFGFGKLSLTAFMAKADPIADLISPDLMLPVGVSEVAQIGGARLVIGTGFAGNLGLTWYSAGLDPAFGTTSVFGADLNTAFGNLGLSAEWAQCEPSDTLEAVVPATGSDNTAWNAKLSYQMGNLSIAGGFTTVESNYYAPGYWSRNGAAVNLRNVQGPTASVSYALGSNLSLSADAQFLEPDDDAVAVTGRTATDQSAVVSAGGLDKITSWKAGLKYGLSSANTIDLGYEQVSWEPIAGADAKEKYISIGIGHSLNANASLKLMYQIVEYEAGAINPYPGLGADSRGGVGYAQFQLKY
ncbi:MAG: S-layer homology domain-containing protein [Armatimonadota bacterium]